MTKMILAALFAVSFSVFAEETTTPPAGETTPPAAETADKKMPMKKGMKDTKAMAKKEHGKKEEKKDEHAH